jgi:CheY-like chemotaxis protein
MKRDTFRTGPANGSSPPSDKVLSSSHYRILIVDDYIDAAKTLAMTLKIMGHTPRMAHDGLEALKVAEEFLPDVVLLDIGLPKLDGYEVCRHIRQQSWGERMVLIALTGWAQDEDKINSKDAGFNCHLVKPIDSANLRKLLDGLLSAPV